MKIKGSNNIHWRDDNHVDFSRKRRVSNNGYVSKEYMKFSPEDQTIETDTWDGNPSVNKRTYRLSDCFSDTLDDKKYKLNRGNSSRGRTRDSLDSFFDRLRDRLPDDDD